MWNEVTVLWNDLTLTCNEMTTVDHGTKCPATQTSTPSGKGLWNLNLKLIETHWSSSLSSSLSSSRTFTPSGAKNEKKKTKFRFPAFWGEGTLINKTTLHVGTTCCWNPHQRSMAYPTYNAAWWKLQCSKSKGNCFWFELLGDLRNWKFEKSAFHQEGLL